MDAKQQHLEKKLKELLDQAAAVAVEIQAVEQGGQTPHFDEIELPAHAIGQELSRQIQVKRTREVAAAGLAESACPTCQRTCPVETKDRRIHSMDGPIEITETVAHCRCCRRSFFPSAH